jgi:glycerol kinase
MLQFRSAQKSFQIFPKTWSSSQGTKTCVRYSSYVCSIDQGTSSTRFIIFNRAGEIIGMNQKEHNQFFPSRGHVEHNPEQIWKNTLAVINETMQQTKISRKDIVSVGITNQRETTVVWNR